MFLRVLCPRLYSAPLLQKPKQQSSQTSAFPVRFTTTCPSRVALPIYRVGADTELSSQRPIQSLAYETSSSAVIPYTSSAYSHIQNSGLASCLYEIEGTQGIVRADVFSLVIKGFLTLHFGNQTRNSSKVFLTKLLRVGRHQRWDLHILAWIWLI